LCDAGEWIEVPPIIDKALFERVRQVVERSEGGRPARAYVLSGLGLLKCAVCASLKDSLYTS
jgi:hypothetical protein